MGLLSWNDVGITSMIILVLLCLLIHSMIFHSYLFVGENSSARQFWTDALNKCYTEPCDTPLCKKYTSLRDDGYLKFSKTPETAKTCLLTGWEISHFVFHMFLGYFYNIYISLGISVGYEVYEHYVHNCAGIAELGINMFGFLSGAALKAFIQRLVIY